MNFAKFSRTPFFTEHFRWLLLEAALKKMSKDEVITLTLDIQVISNSTLADIADLKSDFGRLESDMSISR